MTGRRGGHARGAGSVLVALLTATFVLVAGTLSVSASSLTTAVYAYDEGATVVAGRDAASEGINRADDAGLDHRRSVPGHSYDDRSNLARAFARPDGYRLAPQTAGRAGAGGLVDDAAAAGPPNRIYSARELIRRAEEPGPYHNFPESFDDLILEQGSRTVVPGYYNKAKPLLTNDSIQYRLPGSINGADGMYEIFARPSISGRNEVIMHRFFRPFG